MQRNTSAGIRKNVYKPHVDYAHTLVDTWYMDATFFSRLYQGVFVAGVVGYKIQVARGGSLASSN